MLKLFDFAFEPRLEDTEKLYFHTEDFLYQENMLTAQKANAGISFDSYFNCVPIAKLRNYTTTSELVFCFETEGRFNVELFADSEKIKEMEFTANGELTVKCSEIPRDAKLLYPILTAKQAGFHIRKISVFAKSKQKKKVCCALIFCTYKREEFIIENINYIERKLVEFGCRDEVEFIVVDNGRTLLESDFDASLTLLPNRNTGGSGGFRRGMEYASESRKFTHFLLADDDILVDFISLQKMLNFLKLIKTSFERLSISGSMLYLDRPSLQFEAGGNFSTSGTSKGFGHSLDLSDAKNLIKNEADNPINYGGWWMMCMPICCIKEGNFPLPFFLKYDDVEYALRCKLKIITLNGVGVWHQCFEEKYNSVTEYYNTRNYLHLCSLHCRNFDEKKAKKFVRKRIRAKRRRQQYKMAQAILLGYRDFKKGMDYLESLDAEANHQRVCELNYKFLSYDEIEKRYGICPAGREITPILSRRQLFCHPELFLCHPEIWLPKKCAFTDYFYDSGIQYWGAKMAVHCNSQRDCGYVTDKKDKENFQWKKRKL